ncbi:hypothetical protein GCM10011339_33730 [Echinicola rosea]|uniref:Uncharacterized protein n=1 Tax=Echinicola rosea TaxID=1807691 RepID=A0ABQ1V7G5_9BACT|nr:hypothetical protein GCM10011339_33730 [Echinicola rosea]
MEPIKNSEKNKINGKVNCKDKGNKFIITEVSSEFVFFEQYAKLINQSLIKNTQFRVFLLRK